jgi:hypothetical protein
MYKNHCNDLTQETHVPNQAAPLGFVVHRVLLVQTDANSTYRQTLTVHTDRR